MKCLCELLCAKLNVKSRQKLAGEHDNDVSRKLTMEKKINVKKEKEINPHLEISFDKSVFYVFIYLSCSTDINFSCTCLSSVMSKKLLHFVPYK